MTTRSEQLLRIRPERPDVGSRPESTSGEAFQNTVLRPVLKLQNPLLIAAFINYAIKHKGQFFELNPQRQLAYIENAIQKDIKFRNALKGMVIGQFTLEEFADYTANSSALNKRMMHLVIERLKDQLQLLQAPSTVY